MVFPGEFTAIPMLQPLPEHGRKHKMCIRDSHNSTLIEWSYADGFDTAHHSIIDGKNVNGGVQGAFGGVRDGIFINKVVDGKYNRIMMMLDCEIGAVECWINGESVYRQEGLKALMDISSLKDYRCV